MLTCLGYNFHKHPADLALSRDSARAHCLPSFIKGSQQFNIGVITAVFPPITANVRYVITTITQYGHHIRGDGDTGAIEANSCVEESYLEWVFATEVFSESSTKSSIPFTGIKINNQRQILCSACYLL